LSVCRIGKSAAAKQTTKAATTTATEAKNTVAAILFKKIPNL
jgi:hypothetical protein